MGSPESTETSRHGWPRGETRPVSRKEEALWLLERLVPDGSANNVPGAAIRVAGRLARQPLEDAVVALLRRHEALRTVFRVADGALVKELVPQHAVTSVVERREVGDQDELRSVLAEFVLRPFPLDGGPLLRVGHFTVGDGDVLCLAVHHLVFDAMSTSIFLEELAVAYGAAVGGHDLTTAPVDVVPAWPEPETGEASLAFWRKHLDGFDPYAARLWVGDRTAGGDSLAGSTTSHLLSPEAVAVLRDCRRQLRAPDAVVLLAAYYLLLARHGAGPDFAVGLPVNIRGPLTQRTIGYHVNILPLRNRVGGERTVREFVRDTRDVFLEAIGHADAPVDVLMPEAPRLDSSWRSALFRHVFNYLPGRGTSPIRFGDLPGRLEVVETGSSKFDLEFVIATVPDGYEVKAVYSTAVHTERNVELLLRRYDALLTELGRDPEQRLAEVGAWCPEDLAAVDAAHAPHPYGPPRTLPAVVAARATATPDAVAVEENGRTLTYAALWQASRATAALLREHGVTPGDQVSVRTTPGAAGLTALLGVWLAGAVSEPVAPVGCCPPAAPGADAGTSRIAADGGPVEQAAADGETSWDAPDDGTALLVPDGRVLRPVPVSSRPGEDDEAGDSVGAYDPDTVAAHGAGGAIGHADLAALMGALAEELAAEPGGPVDAVWHGAPGCASQLPEMWLPLATGGRVVAVGAGESLPTVLERHPAALLRAAPGTWWDLLADGVPLSRPALLTEAPPLGLAHRLVGAGARPYQLRVDGAGVWGVQSSADPGDRWLNRVRPVPGVRIAVTGPEGQELPLGVTGEIRVSRGSWEPVGAGLLGRWTDDGRVEVLGSSARRLFRLGDWVEPERIEAVLAEHPAVAHAAVVEVCAGDATLVALVRTVPGQEPPDPVSLRAHTARLLPGAAVPSHVVVVDTLPATADGVVDLLAVAERAAAVANTAPAAGGDWTPLLVGFWNTLTNRQDLGPHDNFFSSGGHSLMAAQLVQRVEEDTGVRLRLADVFENPTPAGLAGRMTTLQEES
ncbi:condensation domain-containing protein [Streptomyces sp. SID13726]|uniref:condensation domain-containing protein n=1 Tax=Streptomyces sp. SID13726 TaxID=2706058 RepID=UPI0013B61FDB|nr:condensation domain-containing protein [Streptomyces sp. SID13726]NEA99058.1 AMP-binding protein [Streptomyces sp. SID13726]